MAKLVFLFLTIIVFTSCKAATYYVSSSGGNDNNDGLSADRAWQTLKKVNAFRSFRPGDKILLKAGDRFQGPLELRSSGTRLNPISVGKYGAGDNPLIYGDHADAVWTAVPGHAGVYSTPGGSTISDVYDESHYYKRDQKKFAPLDAWLDTVALYRFGWDKETNRLYVHSGTDDVPAELRLYEFGAVRTYSPASHIIFENLAVRNTYNGFFTNGTDITIRNCNTKYTLLHGISLDNADSCTISGNTIDSTTETGIYLKKTTATWVHHNTVSNTIASFRGVPVHSNIGEQCGIGLQQGANNLVEHNELSNLKGAFFDYYYEHGSVVRFNRGYKAGGCGSQHGTALQFYGNRLNVNGGTGMSANYHYDPAKNPAATPAPILTFNNTVLNFTNYGLFSSTDSVVFRNNIVVTNSSAASFTLFYPGTSSDYNCFYFSAPSSRGWRWGLSRKEATYVTLDAYRSATGQDLHSLNADPKLVSLNPQSLDEFKLTALSPCIGKGQNLKSVDLATSGNRVSRNVSDSQTSNPDIGAYEF